ncbi:MAG TPA: Fe-S cluster assembly protein SufD [Verrucomicrobiae bacterium]|nr:Fe-S cluster assembly protein SufD [Verrucomicrobiae bacterium]
MITATQAPERYLEAFEEFNRRAGRQPAWLRSIREEAFAQFSEAGFPTTHDEDWRFTNVSAIAQTPFDLAVAGAAVSAKELGRFDTAGFACLLVFVNGNFAPHLSRIPVLAKGVTVVSLADAIAQDPAALEPHLTRYLNTRRDAFCALNTAFIEDGAFVHVPRNTVVEQPVYLLYVSTPGEHPYMTNPRNLIVVEQGSQVAVVEDYVSLGPGVAFSNTATELVAGDNAVVSHTMIVREDTQAYNVSTLRIQQGRSANVATHSVLLGGALVRNNVHPVLAGEGGECLINGLFIGVGRQHLDNYMLVEHASPHCGSRQFYNGILSGQSHGVFHGRIIVHKDAQKTDAKQTNRNLLLSDDAQIDTKPQLEIYADDVKCTHGATIGKLEAEALFYARSRGLDEASARHLLLLAFANECLDRMPEGAVRDHLERLIMESLPSAISSTGTQSAEIARSWEEVG